jgi:hypothetical protein
LFPPKSLSSVVLQWVVQVPEDVGPEPPSSWLRECRVQVREEIGPELLVALTSFGGPSCAWLPPMHDR